MTLGMAANRDPLHEHRDPAGAAGAAFGTGRAAAAVHPFHHRVPMHPVSVAKSLVPASGEAGHWNRTALHPAVTIAAWMRLRKRPKRALSVARSWATRLRIWTGMSGPSMFASARYPGRSPSRSRSLPRRRAD